MAAIVLRIWQPTKNEIGSDKVAHELTARGDLRSRETKKCVTVIITAIIVGGKNNSVTMQEMDWRPLEEAWYLLHILGLHRTIGRTMHTARDTWVVMPTLVHPLIQVRV